MKRSHRELLIDMVEDVRIFQNNRSALSPCFTFKSKTGMGPPKTRVLHNCEVSSLPKIVQKKGRGNILEIPI